MSGYFQALLYLACALPVSSTGPLFTDVTQAAGIAFVNESGERQVFQAVPADRHYVIHRGVDRLILE